jgi:hypothetical protein
MRARLQRLRSRILPAIIWTAAFLAMIAAMRRGL